MRAICTQVLCNSLLPVRGPRVGETAYISAVLGHWEALLALSGVGLRRNSSLRQADATPLRLSLVAADVAALLERFAHRRSFSEDAHGGGRDSNARLLPALLQLGRYYAEQCFPAELQPLRALVAAHSAGGGGGEGGAGPSGSSPGGIRIAGAGGTAAAAPVPYILVLCLLLQSPAEWAAARRTLLARTIGAGVQAALEGGATPGASPSGSACSTPSMTPFGTPGSAPSPTRPLPPSPGGVGGGGSAAPPAPPLDAADLTPAQLFRLARPSIALWGLADWLQGWAKGRGRGAAADWGAAMKGRLEDLPGVFQAAADMLEALGDVEDADSAAEALDVLSALPDVLSAGCGSADDFMREACASLPRRR
jgi:E3 ubiquitin-protein ligase UBR4